ncbi:hypothetical protein PROFUN_11351 [Planoprotostelium fungivorum]|uniref:Corrinoid adenosyltransferase MMAB n=1 Tax=Planoprotostelium fungivorum TaxID=1890364 RepID=A0A2P6NAE1_9EUKA|nr:hypothetical protein PROFUN_11351 [Planoprotostelium fungivorum]
MLTSNAIKCSRLLGSLNRPIVSVSKCHPLPFPSLHSQLKQRNSLIIIPHRGKVYTKTGDKGTSSLFNGERRPKTDPIFDALGDTDELNNAVGIAREFVSENETQIHQQLEQIQNVLLDVGANIATPRNRSDEKRLERTAFAEGHVTDLEHWIDEMEKELPPLRNFILPSGGKGAVFLHSARSICRRAERAVVDLPEEVATDEAVKRYMNRLSDYLFVAARYSAFREGKKEIVHNKPTPVTRG